MNPSDPVSEPNQWWRGASIYQIYPRSFYDSKGDGIGDLAGICDKLPYVKSLGVDAIWISPFFLSPMLDFGYDVADYRKVDPIFGDLEDFKVLLASAHGLGLKVIIDQVISHTSDQHDWFKLSRCSRDNDKADWFIWHDPKPDGTPPNNWQSVFGGTAWQWDARRQQYYLHNFLPSQPDLNYHNEGVRAQILEEVKFWLDLGVDGFRLDTVNYYFHDNMLRDNPANTEPGERAINPYYYQQHIYDKNRPETLAFLPTLRALCEQYPGTMLLGEIGDIQAAELMEQYTAPGKLHTAYSFDLLSDEFSAGRIAKVLNEQQAMLQQGWPTWAFSNHDVTRVASRWCENQENHQQLSKLLLALLCCLKGSICLYQGEELGLEEAEITFEQLQDPWGINLWPEYKGRDGCRTPMPWQGDAVHSGFSETEPWLPIPGQHTKLAVAGQEQDPNSILQFARVALRLRQDALFRVGKSSTVRVQGDGIWFERSLHGRSAICAFNLGNDTMSMPEHWSLKKVLLSAGGIATREGKLSSLPGFGFVVAEH